MVKSSSCCEEQVGLKKGPWSPEEDQKLLSYIQLHGAHGSWSSLPAKAGLRRYGKSCRLRWSNYLRPDIKRGNFSSHEDQTIIQLHALLGNRWSVIANKLPKRTDNEIKNYWNTHLKKRLSRMGINPTTHKPVQEAYANLSHMAQWESARLQAEARQVKEYCKLQLRQNQLGSSSSKPSLTHLVLNKVKPRPQPPPCLDVLRAWQNSWSSSTSSADHNIPQKNHSMYAMMLSTDDLESPESTLSFLDTVPANPKCNNSINNTFGQINQSSLPNFSSTTSTVADHSGNKVGSLGEEDNIMAAMEAFRSSTGYNCNSMENLHDDEDVLVYGDDWEAILDLVNDSPPVFPEV